MKKIVLTILLVLGLSGCGAHRASALSVDDQQTIMREVAASRHASATAFAEYMKVCLSQFPQATNVRDDGGARLSIQGAVNVALNNRGHEIVCSVTIDNLSIDRIWLNQRTYTLSEYIASERDRVHKTAAITKDAADIASGNYDLFTKRAKRGITDRLKDPDSALFRDLFISNTATPTLCGEINAKNSYGGYVGYKKFFYNSIANYIEPTNSSDDWVTYQQLAKLYCSDKFADAPR